MAYGTVNAGESPHKYTRTTDSGEVDAGTGSGNLAYKIATIDVSEAWAYCSGYLMISAAGTPNVAGILHMCLRVGDEVDKVLSARMEWVSVNTYPAPSVCLVEVGTGLYDMYILATKSYTRYEISGLFGGHSANRITFTEPASGGWVSVTSFSPTYYNNVFAANRVELISPSGYTYKLKVGDDGTLSAEKV